MNSFFVVLYPLVCTDISRKECTDVLAREGVPALYLYIKLADQY